MRTILFSAFILLLSPLFSQSFNKGYSTGDAGIGFIYLYNELTDPDSTWKSSDTTGGMIVPVNYEYGVLPWLGAGGMFRFINYIEGDSSNAQAVGMDLSFRLNLHAVRSKRWDILAGATFGYSRVRYFANDAFGSEITGGGSNFGLNGCIRLYFNDHFGMHLNGGYASRNFPSLLATNSVTQKKYHYQESGFELGVGIQISIRPAD